MQGKFDQGCKIPVPDFVLCQACVAGALPGRKTVARMEKKISLPASIATIAPMFGFLGTVVGMIRSFYNISIANDISIGIIAGGIYEVPVEELVHAVDCGQSVQAKVGDRYYQQSSQLNPEFS